MAANTLNAEATTINKKSYYVELHWLF